MLYGHFHGPRNITLYDVGVMVRTPLILVDEIKFSFELVLLSRGDHCTVLLYVKDISTRTLSMVK